MNVSVFFFFFLSPDHFVRQDSLNKLAHWIGNLFCWFLTLDNKVKNNLFVVSYFADRCLRYLRLHCPTRLQVLSRLVCDLHPCPDSQMFISCGRSARQDTARIPLLPPAPFVYTAHNANAPVSSTRAGVSTMFVPFNCANLLHRSRNWASSALSPSSKNDCLQSRVICIVFTTRCSSVNIHKLDVASKPGSLSSLH